MGKITFRILIITMLLTIIDLQAYCQQVTFDKHFIDKNFAGIHVIKVYDMDGDGDFDIIGGSQHTPTSTSVGIAWWRNEGGDPIHWTKFIVDYNYKHVMSIDVDTINNDGFPDMVASSWENGTICWWKNSGDPTQGWVRNVVVAGWTNPHSAVCSDLDNDGKVDIVGVSPGNNRVSVFYNDDMILNEWEERVLTNSFYGAHNATLGDLDDDGKVDIIVGTYYCTRTAWWKNSGLRTSWTKNTIVNSDGCSRSTLCDINKDGQIDIIGSAWYRDEIFYWICNDITENSWTKRRLANGLGIPAETIGSDIDSDGDIDIITVSYDPGELVIYYRNISSFEKIILESSFFMGSALAVLDFDKDGDIDIIAGASGIGDLCFFENSGIGVNIDDVINRNIKIYPNPSKGNIRIENSDLTNNIKDLQIFNINGEKLYFKTFKDGLTIITLNLGFLEDGIYCIQLNTNNGFITRKIYISNTSPISTASFDPV